MPVDGRGDRLRGALAEPGLEDGGVGPPVAVDPVDDELVGTTLLAVERDDAGAQLAHDRGHDPHAVQSAQVRHDPAVPRAAAGGDPGPRGRLGAQVSPQPWLAIAQERHGTPLGLDLPDAAARDRHDDAAGVRVQDDPDRCGLGSTGGA